MAWLLVLAAWGASLRWNVGYCAPTGAWGFGDGFVGLLWFGERSNLPAQWVFDRAAGEFGFLLPDVAIDFSVGFNVRLTIPFWLLFLTAAFPTTFMGSGHRQARSGATNLALLLVSLLAALFVGASQEHQTLTCDPTVLDLTMALWLPLGSFLASRGRPYRPLHFAYGICGALVFLGRFSTDAWFEPVFGVSNSWVLAGGWLVFFVTMGWLCQVVATIRAPRDCSTVACSQCDYNLTGNVSGKCPECGEAINVPVRQADGPASNG